MFSTEAREELFSTLKEQGYQGDMSSLIQALGIANLKTELQELYCIIERKHLNPELMIPENVAYIKELINKLIKKYGIRACSIHDCAYNPAIHFQSKKHPTKGYRFIVSLYIKDQTNMGTNGYYGGKHVRILYGYDDHRAEKIVELIKKEKYVSL